MAVNRLAYVSTPMPTIAATDIADILAVSRRRNLELGVTGLLVHEFGRFTQLLEGSTEAIETLMGSIIRDPRHFDIRIFLQQTAAERSLERWAMWSNYATSAATPRELETREEIVRAALESLAAIDRDRRRRLDPQERIAAEGVRRDRASAASAPRSPRRRRPAPCRRRVRPGGSPQRPASSASRCGRPASASKRRRACPP